MGQAHAVLRALIDCNAFSMGVHYIYHDQSVCYAAADKVRSLSDMIDLNNIDSNEFDQGLNSWASLDVITPEDTFNGDTRSAAGASCAEGMSAGALAHALTNGTCFSPAAPFGDPGFLRDLGFPSGMEIVRWLDRYGKGMYLGLNCGSTLIEPSLELQRCINSSAQLANARGAWSRNFDIDDKPVDQASFQLKGDDQGAFCPAYGNLRIYFFTPRSYRCSNGVQSRNVSLLNDEIAALKGVRYFAYFRCLSYDELNGVYVGTVGVLMSVAMATSALYVTDVARPMLLAAREDWSWDVVLQSAGAIDPEAKKRRWVRTQKVVDVILRCTAGCALGSALGMCLMYLPWRVFFYHHGQSCNPA